MKYLIVLLSVTLSTVCCQAQPLRMDQVPAAVSQAFKVKFPQASQPGWSRESEAVYEVDFFNGKKPMSATFDPGGKWLETETELHYGGLPRAVQHAFEQQFVGYQVQEVYAVETPQNGLIYELTAFKGADNFEARFTAKGELLKKEAGDTGD